MLQSLKSRSEKTTPLAPVARNRRKRFSMRMVIGSGLMLAVVLLAGGVAFVVQNLATSHAESRHRGMTTINDLTQITQIGSTATLLDAQGQSVTVDPNPYKIALAPENFFPGVEAGDPIVSNIGNADHGTTLALFRDQQGPARLFTQTTSGLLGPAGLAFEQDRLLVANSTGNNVLVFSPNGTLLTTLTDPLFNGPWGITAGRVSFHHSGTVMTFFTANKFDARILRVDVTESSHGSWQTVVTQIGQLPSNGSLTKIDLHWQSRLRVGSHLLRDVLLAIDPAQNRVAAFAQSSSLQGTDSGTTIFAGQPLNQPGGLSVNPLNGDLLIVNLMDNNLVELNPTTGKVIGVKQIDPAQVDNQGNGSALFGVVATTDAHDNLRVFFTDDNTNTLDILQ